MPDGSFNGLTIGTGTGGPGQVALVARTGLRGPARRRDSDEPDPMGGTVPGPDDRDARTVTLTLGMRGFDDAEFRVLRRAVLDAFVPGVIAPYTFDDSTAYVLGRVVDADVPEDLQFGAPQRLAEATVVLGCPDELIYGADITGSLSAGPGLAVANPGTAEAPFEASIPACSDPRIRRADDTTGRVYRWSGLTIPGGQTLQLDTRARTARIGSTDVWPPTDDDGNPSVPWGIPPGGETLLFASGSGSPTVTITSRSASST